MTDADFIARLTADMLSGRGTLSNTLELCEQAIVGNIPGDFCECGVYRGVHPALMARAITKHGETHQRLVHLFDSFEGIPGAGPRDDETITGCIKPGDELTTTGHSRCSVQQVEDYMEQWGVDRSLLIYHPGWFQHTVEPASRTIPGLAVLRLDCDLYSSTMACLPHLYPLLSSGGYFISDDWTLTGAREATLEYLRKTEQPIPEPIPVADGIGAHWWRKP